MKKLLICFAVLILSLSATRPKARADCAEDPRDCFQGYEDGGVIIPNDDSVIDTFNFPPVKAGFIIDFNFRDILPHIAVEFLELNFDYVGDLSFDVGVSTSRIFTSANLELIPLIKAGPCVWLGYNVKEDALAYGIGFSILDF